MNDDAVIPESDRAPGDAPHPRETEQLAGQKEAEQEFLDACKGGRLHHAWLIAGPKGVGKATLAWRIARFLLTSRQQTALACLAYQLRQRIWTLTRAIRFRLGCVRFPSLTCFYSAAHGMPNANE